jgi:hypothetical protein
VREDLILMVHKEEDPVEEEDPNERTTPASSKESQQFHE